MSASEAKHDIYVDDILASKDRKGIVENIVDIDRGLPAEGVLTLYIESMSNLNGVYSAVESILREIFSPNLSHPESKYNISLYLEVKEHHKNHQDGQEKAAPLVDSYTVEIDNASVENKLQCFKFIEKHISRNHIINNWKHMPLQLSDEKLSALSEATLVVSLYLECSPLIGSEMMCRRLCGQAQISLEGVLHAANQDGIKETVGMVSDTREIICYLNCTVNYSKVGFEGGNYIVDELKSDIKQKADDFKHHRLYIRLSDLILLKHRDFVDQRARHATSKVAQRPTTYTIRALLGRTELRSLKLKIPGGFGDIFKLILQGLDESNDFSVCIDMSEIERFITDKAMLEKFLNSKSGSTNFQALPPFTIELTETDEEVVINKIGQFEFNLVDLLASKDKSDNKSLTSIKAYLPLLDKERDYSTAETTVARVGLDVIILKTNKIKNKHTLEDICKVLTNQRLRSLRSVQNNLISMPSASYLPTEVTFDVPSVTKLLKEEYHFANSEISEIIDLLGKTSEGKEVDFFKVITSPLMISLTRTAAEATNLGMNLDELLREFKFLDVEKSGYISYGEAFKVFNLLGNQLQVGMTDETLKKKLLDSFTCSRLASEQRPLLDRMKSVENKFDYLLFLVETYSKQVSYDLNDLKFDSKFSRLNKDLESINLLQRRLENPGVVTRDSDLQEAAARPHSILNHSKFTQRPLTQQYDGQKESALEGEPSKWRSVDDSKVDGYYDTWHRHDWKANQAGDNTKQGKDLHRSSGQTERRDCQKDYYLAITVISAENLILSGLNEAPNAMFRASFTLYDPEHRCEQAKTFTSDVIPRQSRPEWNFQMSLRFTDLESFLEANRDEDLCIELIHLKPVVTSLQSSATEEQSITSMSVKMLADFTKDDANKLLKKEVMEVRKDLTVQNEDGVKLHIIVEILADGESLANPFKEGAIGNYDQDLERDSLWKTKKTLDELRQLGDIDPEDKNILADPKAFENLKYTLSSSELYKPYSYSQFDQHSRKDYLPNTNTRPNSLIPAADIYRSEYDHISEPGRLFDPKASDARPQISPEDKPEQRKRHKEYTHDGKYQQKTSSHEQKIHFEDHDPVIRIPEIGHQAARTPHQDTDDKQQTNKLMTSQNDEEQMRPTPDFQVPIDTLKDDSQEGASSYNPFRQNLLNKDADQRVEEHSSDSNKPRTRSKKDADSLLKGIKSKIPGGKLRDEDLERIERIFKNRKFDAKAFDLEDSDIDYF